MAMAVSHARLPTWFWRARKKAHGASTACPAQIRQERNAYYDRLEATQKGGLDITPWLDWFLSCLDRAFDGAEAVLANVFLKARYRDRHAQAPFNPRQRDMLGRLLDGFEGKLTSSKWAKIEKCSPDTALRDINELINQGRASKESRRRA